MGVARQCKRCGHKWEQRTLAVDASEKPIQCPKCKSTKWDNDRTPPRGAKPAKKEQANLAVAAAV